ncbi:MAG: transcription-repair coupling factor [Firmicutes bacterium]|nr:transcription-repair coupling factor [Bacillota bacterium]
MRAITAPLEESTTYQKIRDHLRVTAGAILAEGCQPTQELHLAYALSEDPLLHAHARLRLIITSSDKRAREIQEQNLFYDKSTVLFPAKDLIFYQADLRGNEIETERLRCLRRLIDGKPTTVVTTFAALMTPQVPLKELRKNILVLGKNTELSLEELAARLVSMGYVRTAQVDSRGQFAIRGDIADIFDLTEDNPYRLEFFGDEITDLRSFDIETQRSLQELNRVRIYPASELILPEKAREDGFAAIEKEEKETAERFRRAGSMEAAKRIEDETGALLSEARDWSDYSRLESCIRYFYPEADSFLDLFPREETLLFLEEPSHLWEQAQAVEAEFAESMSARADKGYILPGQMNLLFSKEETLARVAHFRRLGMAGLAIRSEFFAPEEVVTLHTKSIAPYNKSFSLLEEDLHRYRREQYRVVLLSASRTRAKRLAQDLTNDGLTASYSENPEKELELGEIVTYYGSIQKGFAYPDVKLAVIAETDIFGAASGRPKKKKHRYEGEALQSFADLKVGDYVVHEDHGIGIYRGVEKIDIDGIRKDYIKIEYGQGGILYVLPTELNVLQKYSSKEGPRPKLNSLGSNEWTATRGRVKRAVEEVAQDLVELYAKRQNAHGHVFPKDTVWQKEFEEMFPYEETQDQLSAIEDTKRDMESDKIMDRLICGDVGFGKTEVALRAAFKAVQDDCQVAVLVPTTILAQQHYNTFTERMKNFPVNIALLSRFCTASETTKVLKGLADGTIDIVIGTHKLLSDRVKFKNLGLLVVDEEQRFGVRHKEKIKKLRENVDVLTLSATPIPRTLHMSLVGIRDMSVLEEAPQDRQPIQTYVMEYNEELVREAILRELGRGGQVYFVHNTINDIDLVTSQLQQLVPEARIAYAHGRMHEGELEKIMYEFISGELDVLVSTTIIETGLDIPNVNTIIIHDADRMGLSQLYQLRGRVGRSSRTAYAYLMYRRNKLLREVAEQRLAAIREFTDLGSGFRIAMRDLEIRGAGAVLGDAQSGHMAEVGYELYCKMLDAAVRRAKGIPVQEEKHTSVNLPVDAFIPESYILNEEQKLDIYKRIAAVSSAEECDDVRDEMRDRFGEKIPEPAENLLRVSLIRSTAQKMEICDISGSAGTAAGSPLRLRFTLEKNARVQVENIPRLLHRYAKRLRFFPNGTSRGDLRGLPYFELEEQASGSGIRDTALLLAAAEQFLADFSELLRGNGAQAG